MALRRRWAGILAAAVALGSAAAWGRPAETLRLCVGDGREERAAAALLARFLSTARLEAGCGGESAALVGRFEERAGRVTFVLETRSGQIIERAVPWIAPSPTPLAHLTAADRLSEFSILVDGALAEQRWRRRELAALAESPARAESPAPAQSSPPVQRSAAESPRGDESLAAIELAPRPREPVLDLAPIDLPAPELRVAPPPPKLAAFVARPPDRVAAPKRERPRRAQVGAAPARPMASPTLSATAPRSTGAPTLGADAWVAFIHRAPGLSRPQLGVTLSWWRLFARGAYESSDWRWEGRHIGFSALSAELGGRIPLLQRGIVGLAGTVAGLAEAVTLRRHDTVATAHRFWDLGGTAGLELGFRFRPWLRASLGLDAGYRPTRRDVVVEGGDSIAFNAWSARAGLGLGVLW
jgi:hypothetical protein